MRIKPLLAVILASTFLLSACGGENSSSSNSSSKSSSNTDSNNDSSSSDGAEVPSGEVKTIRMGTHYVQELDPLFIDPVTGESVMDPERLRASNAALAAVLEQNNVQIEFVQYAADVREVLLQSVMANDPICDIGILWGGSQPNILAQNIIQPITPYADIFASEDDQWMLPDKIYNENYFLNFEIAFRPAWPLAYNINYVEAVDSLKENGKTVYPNELFEKGEWTWSKFEDYLTKIDTFYKNSKTPNRPERRIEAFQTDYRATGVQAVYSAGGTLYGDDGISVATPQVKEAASYMDNLFTKKLLTVETWDANSFEPGWTWSGGNFSTGETVFTQIPGWLVKGASTAAAERNESIGLVPFPRSDKLTKDSPEYSQGISPGNSMCLLKGVDEATSKLALEVHKTYFSTFFKELGGVEKVSDYVANNVNAMAVADGLDIFHPEVGDSILTSYTWMAENMGINNLAGLVGVEDIWTNLLGRSLYGVEGTAKYDVAVEAELNKFSTIIDETTAILKSDKIRDTIAPKIDLAEGVKLAFPVGTDPTTIKWTEMLKATDNIDGDLDSSAITIDTSTVDFAAIASYDKGLVAKTVDKSENTGTLESTIIIYDDKNKVAPKIEAKAEYRKIAVDEDASAIKWGDDFIETAIDANEINVKANITADISALDVTTPGEYEVIISVADYAANTASVTVKVTVE